MKVGANYCNGLVIVNGLNLAQRYYNEAYDDYCSHQKIFTNGWFHVRI